MTANAALNDGDVNVSLEMIASATMIGLPLPAAT